MQTQVDMKELKLKLKAIEMQLEKALEDSHRKYFDPPTVLHLFENYSKYIGQLKKMYPSLFNDLPEIKKPESSGTTDFEGRGYITLEKLESLLSQIKIDFVLMNEAGNDLNSLTGLSKRLGFIIEEGGNAFSIGGAILDQYSNLISELEGILDQDLYNYKVNSNYVDDQGQFWGDGQLFRINSKSLQILLNSHLEREDNTKAQGLQI